MEVHGLSVDMISNLPPNIIQTILTLMPIRDAFKTCILSTNWRYHCVNIPKLKFNTELFRASAYNHLPIKCKLLHIIYPILLLHHRPILDFSLSGSQLSSCCEIDQIILHLSKMSTLKIFTLWLGTGDDHKLLSSFFMLQQLTHLTLKNCVFQPPSMFNGFSRLKSLYFYNVSITAKVLLRFISGCPLLKSFTLLEDEKHLTGCWKCDFLELFMSLPMIKNLCMNSSPVKRLGAGVMPQKLPVALVHLRVLKLSGLCFAKEAELRSALLLVTSSPRIEKIKLEMCYPTEVVSEIAMNLLDLLDYSYVTLDHLRELEITNMSNIEPEMNFVKLILGKSPMLKKVGITIDNRVAFSDEIMMLRELLQYQRFHDNAALNISRMKVRGLSLDMISNLPPNIIQTILTLMPIRDAFRTCILSRNWRYHCVNIPKLKFDDELFRILAHKHLAIKWKLLCIIYPILLLHHCPILEFSLSSSQLSSCCEIDQIILCLSKMSTLKSFTLCIGTGGDHKLLSSFFMLQHLRHLKLQNCVFQPPSNFDGFSRLESLFFHNVSMTANVLLRFTSGCPLLKSFTLIEDEKHLTGSLNCDFLELFMSLPMIEHLCMNASPVKLKCFAKGVMLQKLPVALVHLRVLNLSGLCFAKEAELRSALLLVTNSQNIEKIKLEMCLCYPTEVVSQSAMNLLDLLDYSDVTLDYLREFEITNMSNIKPEMDCVKFILGKSPMLKKVGITIYNRVAINAEVMMLRELLQYQRASANAKIIFKRP